MKVIFRQYRFGFGLLEEYAVPSTNVRLRAMLRQPLPPT
jgi:hypothetical protein